MNYRLNWESCINKKWGVNQEHPNPYLTSDPERMGLSGRNVGVVSDHNGANRSEQGAAWQFGSNPALLREVSEPREVSVGPAFLSGPFDELKSSLLALREVAEKVLRYNECGKISEEDQYKISVVDVETKNLFERWKGIAEINGQEISIRSFDQMEREIAWDLCRLEIMRAELVAILNSCESPDVENVAMSEKGNSLGGSSCPEEFMTDSFESSPLGLEVPDKELRQAPDLLDDKIEEFCNQMIASKNKIGRLENEIKFQLASEHKSVAEIQLQSGILSMWLAGVDTEKRGLERLKETKDGLASEIDRMRELGPDLSQQAEELRGRLYSFGIELTPLKERLCGLQLRGKGALTRFSHVLSVMRDEP